MRKYIKAVIFSLIFSLLVICFAFGGETYSAKVELFAGGVSPVPLHTYISKINISRNGINDSIGMIEIAQRRFPDGCNYDGIALDIENLRGNWQIFVQMGSNDGFKVRLTVFDSNSNIVGREEDSGMFGTVSIGN